MFYRVEDPRPEINPEGGVTFVKNIDHIPEDLTIQDVMQRYGIADHLRVTRIEENSKETVVHRGRDF